jgi:hypothetical protein
MPGLGKKTFTAGDVLIAGDVNNYLMDQTVMNFATVAARSSAIPVPSTGMVSYVGDTGSETPASTIPQIQAYTGAAWQNLDGLTLVANPTFTSTSTWALDNVFSSAFTNYRVVIEWTAAASAAHGQEFRFRSGGSAITSALYFWGYTGRTSAGTVLGNQAGSVNYMEFAQDIGTSPREFTVLEIRSPFTARDKAVIHQTTWQRNSDGTFANTFGAGFLASSTVCDGFQIMATSTFTTTGKVRVYGYRD